MKLQIKRRIHIFLARLGMVKHPDWIWIEGKPDEMAITKSALEGDLYK